MDEGAAQNPQGGPMWLLPYLLEPPSQKTLQNSPRRGQNCFKLADVCRHTYVVRQPGRVASISVQAVEEKVLPGRAFCSRLIKSTVATTSNTEYTCIIDATSTSLICLLACLFVCLPTAALQSDLHTAHMLFDTSNPQAEKPFGLLICMLNALLTSM